MDLAEGHVAAVDCVQSFKGWEAINLGTGRGASVLEVISLYRQVSGKEIAYQIQGRRSGDIASCYGTVNRAKNLLNWVAEKSILEMCSSSYKYSKLD